MPLLSTSSLPLHLLNVFSGTAGPLAPFSLKPSIATSFGVTSLLARGFFFSFFKPQTGLSPLSPFSRDFRRQQKAFARRSSSAPTLPLPRKYTRFSRAPFTAANGWRGVIPSTARYFPPQLRNCKQPQESPPMEHADTFSFPIQESPPSSREIFFPRIAFFFSRSPFSPNLFPYSLFPPRSSRNKKSFSGLSFLPFFFPINTW